MVKGCGLGGEQQKSNVFENNFEKYYEESKSFFCMLPSMKKGEIIDFFSLMSFGKGEFCIAILVVINVNILLLTYTVVSLVIL